MEHPFQDADGPDGRHCDDKRRQRDPARNPSAAPGGQVNDRNQPHPGRGRRRRHHKCQCIGGRDPRSCRAVSAAANASDSNNQRLQTSPRGGVQAAQGKGERAGRCQQQGRDD